MSLPFEPIRLDKQDAYAGVLAVCPQPTSDYSFINLWAWADEYGLMWAWENDLVWIQQTFPEPVYWAPVGDWHGADWPDLLSRHFPVRPCLRAFRRSCPNCGSKGQGRAGLLRSRYAGTGIICMRQSI